MQLEGGYRTWRRHVVAATGRAAARFGYRVVCGAHRLGQEPAARRARGRRRPGARSRDAGAAPRFAAGRLFPASPQPSQKAFEIGDPRRVSRRSTRARPVYVESESRKIGTVQVPDALLARMRAAPCVRVELDAGRSASRCSRTSTRISSPTRTRSRRGSPTSCRCTVARRSSGGTRSRAPASSTRWSAELLESHYDPDLHAGDDAQLRRPRGDRGLADGDRPAGVASARARPSGTTRDDGLRRRTGTLAPAADRCLEAPVRTAPLP